MGEIWEHECELRCGAVAFGRGVTSQSCGYSHRWEKRGHRQLGRWCGPEKCGDPWAG